MKTLTLTILLLTLSITAAAQTCPPLTAGCLDSSFGSAGKIAIPVPSPGSGDTVPRDLAVQSDGKVVVMFGCCATWGLLRINADGSLDTTFGDNGFMITTWNFTQKNFDYFANTNAIALQTVNGEQRILVAGQTPLLSGNKLLGSRLRVDRYTSNGTLDTSFGNNGVSILNVGPAGAIAVQPSDQKILTDGATLGELVRLNVNGTLDTSFGNGGTVDTGFARDLAFDAMGRILVAGQGTVGKGKNEKSIGTLKRYSANGVLDSSFGVNGTATITFTQSFNFRHFKIDSLGRHVFAGQVGSSTAGDADFAVARLTPNGLPDSSFNGNGTNLAGFSAANPITSAVAVQADGKIVVDGGVNLPGSIRDVGVVRFNIDGSLDTFFGNNGRLTFDLGGDDYFSATGGGAIIQLDPGCACEKVVIAGGTPGYALFARLYTF